MRSFLITLLIFLLMLFLIVANSLYVQGVSEEIRRLTSKEEQNIDSAEELESFWERNMPFLSLSVPYSELERVSELITELKHYTTVENESEKDRIQLLIKEAASDICRPEKLGSRFIF